MDQRGLPHLTGDGRVQMVDVSQKASTKRRSRAEGFLYSRPDVVDLVRAGSAPKGDVLAVARVAAIMGAKRTPEWIPLCHSVALQGVDADIEILSNGFRIEVAVVTVGTTGVEMEALTAVTAGLLTLYDMLKAQDRSMSIGPIRLLEKSGGRSGTFQRVRDTQASV